MKNFRKYVVIFKLGIQTAMEYRVNFILSIFGILFPMVINIFLWKAVYNGGQGGIVFGYNYNQMLVYTLLAGITSNFVSAGFAPEIASDIRDGGLNKFLTQPMGYVNYRISSFFGGKAFQSSILAVLFLIMLVFLKMLTELKVELHRMLVFILALALALILNFLIFFIVGLLAFWLTNVGYLFSAMGVLINIASGGLFPLNVFGSAAQNILNLLPFKYIIFYPISIFNGSIDIYQAYGGILVQIFWIIVSGIIGAMLWKRGLKKYVAVGG